MKAARITIRITVLLLTSVWGVFIGLLGPVIIMNSEMGIASHHALRVWLVASVVGYFMPCFLIMLDKSKTAAAFAATGTVLTLYIHSVFSEHAHSFTYLPQIFMTILAMVYIFVINPHYIAGVNEKRLAKLNAPAPSILGGTTSSSIGDLHGSEQSSLKSYRKKNRKERKK
ncbi:MAG: hypothetical protein FWE74_09030 [Oscillospiraceae bacterium]|nr:hypothetical protein [Oscillospiraceae bacterium]